MTPPAAKSRRAFSSGAGVVGRREVCKMLGLGVVAITTGCRAAPRRPEGSRPLAGVASLWSWFDLPEDPRSHDLSSIAWDGATLWAVQDRAPRIVALRPDRELRQWRLGESIHVTVPDLFDLEGIVALPDGFLLSSEVGPRIVEVDRRGALRSELRVAARFAGARKNKSLESLTISPSGRHLFTTSETALENEGELASAAVGTPVRIVRFERESAQIREYTYVTDHALADGAEHGVADLAAIADDELLVLERGWLEGTGNVVRIYRVSLEEPARSARALRKSLVVDLATLPARGLPPPRQPQPSPLLDNYEGLSPGPVLADGRPTLFVVSDDNGSREQVARVLVLAFG